jgi:hypothetical protein
LARQGREGAGTESRALSDYLLAIAYACTSSIDSDCAVILNFGVVMVKEPQVTAIAERPPPGAGEEPAAPIGAVGVDTGPRSLGVAGGVDVDDGAGCGAMGSAGAATGSVVTAGAPDVGAGAEACGSAAGVGDGVGDGVGADCSLAARPKAMPWWPWWP